MKDKFPPGSDVVRLENSCSSGTPDVNVCLPSGMEIWIELKVAFPNYDVLVRKYQKVFGTRRARAGGRVFVIALMPDEVIHCWRYPIETKTKNDEYQLITDDRYYFCTNKESFHHLFEYMQRP